MPPPAEPSWRKKREMEFVMTLLQHLGLMPATVEATEKGADAIVTLPHGDRIAIEVTEPHVVDDGQSPQARANRWYALWRTLQDAFASEGIRGLVYVEFEMDKGWPTMPPSRDFARVAAEVIRHARAWDRTSDLLVEIPGDSPLAPWVRALIFGPSSVGDISSNHQGTFIPLVDSAILADAIIKKRGRPADPGFRWLLIVIGVGLHQPAGTPPAFVQDPDPERVFDRIFVYDGLHDCVFERTGIEWTRLSHRPASDERR